MYSGLLLHCPGWTEDPVGTSLQDLSLGLFRSTAARQNCNLNTFYASLLLLFFKQSVSLCIVSNSFINLWYIVEKRLDL